jgi:hypothetical protein
MIDQHQFLLNIYHQILQEMSVLGGGAIGGFSAPQPTILKKRRKKKKKIQENLYNN